MNFFESLLADKASIAETNRAECGKTMREARRIVAEEDVMAGLYFNRHTYEIQL
jgi:hypothetical protein